MNIDEHRNHGGEDHDGGLAADLPMLMQRRRVLQVIGGGTLIALVGGAAKLAGASAPPDDTSAAAPTDATGVCSVIPEETAGPYPGDGSNGPNVLTEADVVRRDITASVGESTTVAEGIPLAITLLVTDTTTACAPLEGAAVYLWHCDREGRYSMYSEGVENENYLRGVQQADADGKIVFDSVFPGAYRGRWPHIHFEVYQTLDDAVGGDEPIATSQIALPEAVCETVYATEGYQDSVPNLAATPLAQDNVFSDDGGASQLATATGDVDAGIAIELAVGV